MDDELYREEILEHYYDSPHRGHIESPDFAAEVENRLCGDRLRLELALGPDGQIAKARYDGHGCVISQASSSLLAARVEGASLAEARRLTPEDVLGLLGLHLSPARIKCGLLAWRALQKALPAEVKA